MTLVKRQPWSIDLVDLLNLFAHDADVQTNDMIRHWTYTLHAKPGTLWHTLFYDDHTLKLTMRDRTQAPLLLTVSQPETRWYTLLDALFDTQRIVATGYDRKGVARCKQITRMDTLLSRMPEAHVTSQAHRRLLATLRAHRKPSPSKRRLWWKFATYTIILGAVSALRLFLPMSVRRQKRRKK